MNTSKQINVILGLLMVGALATLLYFLWDTVRADDATEHQLTVNAERGGKLFSINCRACHGLTGKGVLENPTLPGAALNVEPNRPTDQGTLAQKQARFRDTIRCGRVGTVMPAWSQEQGGPLNDSQIAQLVALITGTMPGFEVKDNPDPNAVSEKGWENALQVANYDHIYGDEFTPPKELAEAAGAGDTTLVLNNARDLSAAQLLRIDDDPTDDKYEIVSVIDSPAGSALKGKVGAGDRELVIETAYVFKPGDIITVDDETMKVISAPAQTTLAADVDNSAATISVGQPSGFAADDTIKVEGEKMKVQSVSGSLLRVQRGIDDTKVTAHTAGALLTEQGDVIQVERGAQNSTASSHREVTKVYEVGDDVQVKRGFFATKAADHQLGTAVFKGPILPANTITGGAGQQALPPCGQKTAASVATPGAGAGAAPTPSAGQPERPATAQEVQATFTEPANGVIETEAKDNLFSLNDFKVKAGEEVTIKVKNSGSAPHNLRVAGVDGQFKTADDLVTSPDLITAGNSGELKLKLAQAGTYVFHCDFHPNDMWGQITTQ